MTRTMSFFDLDGTLIYSQRSALMDTSGLIPVEKMDNDNVSFMTSQAYKSLRTLIKNNACVPTTTRRTDQLLRVSAVRNVEWAISYNGLVISHYGQELEKWTNSIMSRLPKNKDEVFAKFTRLAKKYHNTHRTVHDGFFYMFATKGISEQQKREVFLYYATLDSTEWNLSIQSRKIFIIPQVIDKSIAMQEVLSLSHRDTSFSAGDSLLDLQMMESSHYAMRPSHGELWEAGDSLKISESIFKTKNAGAKAAEEITSYALNLM